MDTILILHGWGSGAKNWNQVRKLLEKQGYKVFVPDLPGFGENPPPKEAWTISDYTIWVEKFAVKNNLDRFFLMGHSFGGSVAVKFTLKYPKKIKKLFLVDCAGIRRKSIKIKMLKKTANIFRKKFSFLPFFSFFRKVFYKFFLKSDYLHVQGIMRKTLLKVFNEDISKDFSNISVSTVIIWGEKDNTTPLKDAYYIKEKISGAKLEILPDIFHSPQLENPVLLVKKILSYVKN